MNVDPIDLLAGVVTVTIMIWIIWPSSKKKPPPLPPQANPYNVIKTTVEEERYEMADTDAVYDNADSEKLFEAKMQCLDWARADVKEKDDVDMVVDVAKKYWDFLVFDDRADEK